VQVDITMVDSGIRRVIYATLVASCRWVGPASLLPAVGRRVRGRCLPLFCRRPTCMCLQTASAADQTVRLPARSPQQDTKLPSAWSAAVGSTTELLTKPDGRLGDATVRPTYVLLTADIEDRRRRLQAHADGRSSVVERSDHHGLQTRRRRETFVV